MPSPPLLLPPLALLPGDVLVVIPHPLPLVWLRGPLRPDVGGKLAHRAFVNPPHMNSRVLFHLHSSELQTSFCSSKGKSITVVSLRDQSDLIYLETISRYGPGTLSSTPQQVEGENMVITLIGCMLYRMGLVVDWP
jgi:hypothetical protein